MIKTFIYQMSDKFEDFPPPNRHLAFHNYLAELKYVNSFISESDCNIVAIF